jgi:hypothetical protein
MPYSSRVPAVTVRNAAAGTSVSVRQLRVPTRGLTSRTSGGIRQRRPGRSPWRAGQTPVPAGGLLQACRNLVGTARQRPALAIGRGGALCCPGRGARLLGADDLDDDLSGRAGGGLHYSVPAVRSSVRVEPRAALRRSKTRLIVNSTSARRAGPARPRRRARRRPFAVSSW